MLFHCCFTFLRVSSILENVSYACFRCQSKMSKHYSIYLNA